jgi:purine-nucleoside phosphorylase
MRTLDPLVRGPGPGPGDRLPEEAAAVIRERSTVVPDVVVILGSGLGPVAGEMEEDAEISFDGLPGFPQPSVPGHPGRLVMGALGGVPAAVFVGRIHYYEGHPMSLCTLPVRVASLLRAHTIVLTAAVGALDPRLGAGNLVVATDHLNFMGDDPLRGWRRPDGTPPFTDLTAVYDPGLSEAALAEGGSLGLPMARGVYAAVTGPSYETRAEIELLRRAGATVVGMSVVPEAIAAAALGMRVLGLFVVTNATGAGTLDHQDVVRVAADAAGGLGRLLSRMAPILGRPGAERSLEDGSARWTVT